MPPDTLVSLWAEEDLRSLESRGLRRTLEPLGSPQGAQVTVGGQSFVNFSSNDYLGLAGDPRLAQAAAQALERHGVGTGASRLIVGDTSAHHALEDALARFMGAESARVFNAGYAANLGVLSSLCGKEDVIFSDELNHASLIDGCRLSRAETVVYPHRDLQALERLLGTSRGRRRVVCTDTVFSMDGDLAPLEGLVELCRAHEAALVVDEAHALGVLGPRGGGLCEQKGLSAQVDVRVGTLGKAFGAFGAFAAGARAFTELLHNRARSFVFSTGLPAAVCAAAQQGVELSLSDGALRERLWRNIRLFAEGLSRLGIPAQARSAIFPVVLGEPEAALEASRFLRARGLLVKAIRPPTVPAGTSRLRFALSAAHSEAHVQLALDALRALYRKES